MHTREICPVVEAARLIGRRWDLIVIRYLLEGPKHFAELRTVIPNVSSKSLSATLKQLAAKGIVVRKVNSGFPVSVEYSLTRKGKEMGPVVDAMRHWGEKWILTRSGTMTNRTE
jgi:DNA-binding HxlR family transcriptional regulator